METLNKDTIEIDDQFGLQNVRTLYFIGSNWNFGFTSSILGIFKSAFLILWDFVDRI